MLLQRLVKIVTPNLIVENVRVRFEVIKSLIGAPNLAFILIYNLSENTRKFFQSETTLTLYAGNEQLTHIFTGDITNVVDRKEGVDWHTEIYCGDIVNAINDSTINKTYAAGTSHNQIFNDLVGKMEGVKKGVLDGLKGCLSNKRSLLRSLQLSGSVKTWLDWLSKE
jgi:hypothetical protein